MKSVSLVLIITTGLLGIAPAYAQDFSPMADFATARGMTVSQSAAMTDVFRHTLGAGAGTIGSRPEDGRQFRDSSETTATSVALARLRYRSTSSTMQAALSAYIERAKRSNPEAADAADRALGQQDVSAIYRGMVAPFGLHDGNLADALTAYTVLGWMIANDAGDPSPFSVQAARSQLATRLVSDPRLSSDSQIGLGEEFKLSFVILHAGWQSARREGSVSSFAEAVAAMFANQGLDLRAVGLTTAGFGPRDAAR